MDYIKLYEEFVIDNIDKDDMIERLSNTDISSLSDNGLYECVKLLGYVNSFANKGYKYLLHDEKRYNYKIYQLKDRCLKEISEEYMKRGLDVRYSDGVIYFYHGDKQISFHVFYESIFDELIDKIREYQKKKPEWDGIKNSYVNDDISKTKKYNEIVDEIDKLDERIEEVYDKETERYKNSKEYGMWSSPLFPYDVDGMPSVTEDKGIYSFLYSSGYYKAEEMVKKFMSDEVFNDIDADCEKDLVFRKRVMQEKIDAVEEKMKNLKTRRAIDNNKKKIEDIKNEYEMGSKNFLQRAEKYKDEVLNWRAYYKKKTMYGDYKPFEEWFKEMDAKNYKIYDDLVKKRDALKKNLEQLVVMPKV